MKLSVRSLTVRTPMRSFFETTPTLLKLSVWLRQQHVHLYLMLMSIAKLSLSLVNQILS